MNRTALTAAFAAAASAAFVSAPALAAPSVTLYGLVDMGLSVSLRPATRRTRMTERLFSS